VDTPKWQVQKGTEPPGGAHFETDPHTDKEREREIYIYIQHYQQKKQKNTTAKQINRKYMTTLQPNKKQTAFEEQT